MMNKRCIFVTRGENWQNVFLYASFRHAKNQQKQLYRLLQQWHYSVAMTRNNGRKTQTTSLIRKFTTKAITARVQ